MSYEVKFYCVSHIGNIRSINQDNLICNGKFLCNEDEFEYSGNVVVGKPKMFAVFDGMGGEECGEIASFIAAQSAAMLDFKNDVLKDITQYCVDTNDKICEYSVNNGIFSMGTTVAALVFDKNDIVMCNIGDSRVYRFSDKVLSQISLDHTDVCLYRKKPPLSQNLGIPKSEMTIEPYLSKGEYVDGDTYLICSDGLTDMVEEKDIQKILTDKKTENPATELLDVALKNGGKDNITIIICKIKKCNRKLSTLFINIRGKKE